jgi:hypothetical protein
MATVKNGLMRLRSSRTFIAEMLMAFLLAQLTLAVSRGGAALLRRAYSRSILNGGQGRDRTATAGKLGGPQVTRIGLLDLCPDLRSHSPGSCACLSTPLWATSIAMLTLVQVLPALF